MTDLVTILGRLGLAVAAGPEPLAGDGSNRRFYRFHLADTTSRVAVVPGSGGLAEARSTWELGNHLAAAGIPVARPLAYDRESGVVVLADGGDRHLTDWLAGRPPAEVEATYRHLLAILLDMQFRGARGLEGVFRWQGERYDEDLMVTGESGYFLHRLVGERLHLAVPGGVEEECAVLARRAAAGGGAFFLHRDYQSRNILVREGPAGPEFVVIDYQGGRFGPLGYDVAALVRDPYVMLPRPVRQRLLACYEEELGRRAPTALAGFRASFLPLALQRNLQVLGAYAYLSGPGGKPGFARSITPALELLLELFEADGLARHYPQLHLLTREVFHEWSSLSPGRPGGAAQRR